MVINQELRYIFEIKVSLYLVQERLKKKDWKDQINSMYEIVLL